MTRKKLLNLSQILALLLLVSFSFSVSAARVLNLENQALPLKADGSSYTLKQVRTGVISGAIHKGWDAANGEGDEIIASILVRGRHYAEVSITYDTNKYSITYRNSNDLKYNPKKNTIHGNYNKWVINLSNSIKKSLLTAR